MYGEGDIRRTLEDIDGRPSIGAIIHMCLKLGIEKDNKSTVNKKNAWGYFYELFSTVAENRSKKDLYEFFGPMLPADQIDEHIDFINQHKRKTA